MGHLSQNDVTLVTLVAIITIVVSSYLIMNSSRMYEFFEKPLRFLEFRKKKINAEAAEGNIKKDHIILIGANRIGQGILKSLLLKEKDFVVIDFDPHVARSLWSRQIIAFCGDGTDPEVLEAARVNVARVIISTMPSFEDSMVIIKEVRRVNKKAMIILTAESEFEMKGLYNAGADYVIVPHLLGGEQLGDVLKMRSWANEIEKMRDHDIQNLRKEGF